jgi:acetyl esterase
MLDPQASALLELVAAAKAPSFRAVGHAAARRMHAAMVRRLAGPPQPVAIERDFTIPGPGGSIPVRSYAASGGGSFPVLVYFHGGGNVVGDLDMVDEVCRLLARDARCVVLSVDYRLAPEHPYPAALEDAYAAVSWVAANASEIGGDPRCIAVAGDSAGGSLSALVARYARDRGGPALVFQGLIYSAGDIDFSYPSMQTYAEGYLLTEDTIRWFRSQYFPVEPPATDLYAWPMRALSLEGLPPALVITAGFDPLQDSGIAYGERLARAGVPVRFVHYAGMVHGFFVYPSYFERAREAAGEVASALRSAFANCAAPGRLGVI